MKLKKKCRRRAVAKKPAGCLFACNSREKEARELDLLIEDAESRADPIVEQLRQCPEAFTVGRTIENLFQLLRSTPNQSGETNLPPAGTLMSPFV